MWPPQTPTQEARRVASSLVSVSGSSRIRTDGDTAEEHGSIEDEQRRLVVRVLHVDRHTSRALANM